jgi:hypothetical protein
VIVEMNLNTIILLSLAQNDRQSFRPGKEAVGLWG